MTLPVKKQIDGHEVKLPTRMLVPCGECHMCLEKKVKDWQVRILMESRLHKHSYFVTLTYAGEHLPVIIKDDVPVGMTLVKRDVQLFLKRLRHKCSFRYFAMGEYGEEFGRPHYHLVMFSDEPIKSQDIQDVWGKGLITRTYLTPGRAAYVAKYHIDGIGSLCSDAQKPFRLISRMPGLGAGYVQEDSEVYRWHRSSIDNAYFRFNGIKFGLPKYVKQRIYTEEQLKEMSSRSFKDPFDELVDSGVGYQEAFRYFQKKRLDFINKKKGKL